MSRDGTPPPPTPEAGPSAPRAQKTIPSTGLEYWEYRRACFLAGVPFPSCPASEPLPETYTVDEAPEPLTGAPYQYREGSAVARLESLLSDFGAEESNVTWNGGVAVVHRKLTGGTNLTKPLRLGLVIKILRAGWLRDGTWPMDPATRRPMAVPDSPMVAPSRALAALDRVPALPAQASPKSAHKTKGKINSRRDRGVGGERVEVFRQKEPGPARKVEESVQRGQEVHEQLEVEPELLPTRPTGPPKPSGLESPRKSKLLSNPLLGWRWKKKT